MILDVVAFFNDSTVASRIPVFDVLSRWDIPKGAITITIEDATQPVESQVSSATLIMSDDDIARADTSNPWTRLLLMNLTPVDDAFVHFLFLLLLFLHGILPLRGFSNPPKVCLSFGTLSSWIVCGAQRGGTPSLALANSHFKPVKLTHGLLVAGAPRCRWNASWFWISLKYSLVYSMRFHLVSSRIPETDLNNPKVPLIIIIGVLVLLACEDEPNFVNFVVGN